MGDDIILEDDYLCTVCVVEFQTLEELKVHRTTDEHRLKWLNRKYRINRQLFVRDKEGLVIEVETKNENVQHKLEIFTIEVDGDENSSFTMRVVYSGEQDVYLLGVDILNETNLIETETDISLSDIYNINKRLKILHFKKGQSYDVLCNINPGSRVKTLHIPIIFQFGHATDGEPFYLGRTIEIKTGYEVLDFGNYLPGVYPPIMDDELEKNLKLNPNKVPLWFQRVAFDNNPDEIRRSMHIRPTLTIDTHLKFFRTLLWLEELQLQVDIQFYSKKNVPMTAVPLSKCNTARCVELVVEGLAESRPSVLERDQVFACRSIENRPAGINVQWYQGIVHKANNASLYIAFDQDEFMGQFYDGMRFDVEFILNRYTLKVCHRALELCRDKNLKYFLFPPTPQYAITELPIITPYNPNLSNNHEQIQAVKHIVAGSSFPAPYLVFGPPGTGKTVTIVEAIKQVLYLKKGSHVLACAPSNSAADIIAERLLDHLDESHVLRLYAKSRVKGHENISQKLLQASNFRDNKVTFPSKEKIRSKRVVVCTFITAARIASAEFPLGHFSHVVLDEVGHAMECEALVAFGGNLASTGQLVLAGDPHQLGPVVRCMQAIGGGQVFPKTGLDTSYLERLMAMDIYKNVNGRYNPRLVTKLLNNYRSHKSVLKVPNELFYKSELRVKGAPALIQSLCLWQHLPKKHFPLIFHATQGQDQNEPRSPSFFNAQEVNVVVEYLKKLFSIEDSGDKNKVNPAEIGIITPYRLQVEKIRIAIKRSLPQSHHAVKVGSVEDFQGEERKVIIISTVRASRAHLAKDEVFKLGFLRNPKRFNVAVTRAQALLIVVGCPKVLMLDSNWSSLINHIQSGGGYIGQIVKPPTENLDTIIRNSFNIDIRPTLGQISIRQIVEAPKLPNYH